MPRLTLVAAYAANRVIGADGGIPWHIPEDFAHFKQVTMGGVLLMGRATYESIGRPLPGRETVVVTRDPSWSAREHADQVRVVHDLDEGLALAHSLPGEVYVSGGQQIYAQALPLATHQILTEVDLEVDGDTFYPDFDESQWHVVRRLAGPGCAWVWWERPCRDDSAGAGR